MSKGRSFVTHTKIKLLVLAARNAGRSIVLAVSPLLVVVQMVVSSFTRSVQILNMIFLTTGYTYL